MAQSMVNIGMDSDVKKRMEQACTDMGFSMTTFKINQRCKKLLTKCG